MNAGQRGIGRPGTQWKDSAFCIGDDDRGAVLREEFFEVADVMEQQRNDVGGPIFGIDRVAEFGFALQDIEPSQRNDEGMFAVVVLGIRPSKCAHGEVS